MGLVSLEDIRGAGPVVATVARRTPVITSVPLSGPAGDNVALKAENLQRTGSFKLRGAINKVVSLGDTALAGVTTGSAGNHAQALAYAAHRVGAP
ncbi:MAG TPA: pyridoxal-phosphate dependent enzyme, partial [Ilumatobacteraceae bacterium]|nr:pyridoxal-phosphate dependent enzyme [Ilumatobacteraceae bacterium]